MSHVGSTIVLCSFAGALVLAQGCGGSKHDTGFDGPGGAANRGADGGDGGSGNNGGFPGDFNDSGTGTAVVEAGCESAEAATSRAPVYMMIVLDGSGSMDQDNKWVAVVPALDAIFDDFKAKADPSIAVGLLAFSDKKDPTCMSVFPGLPGPCNGPYPSSVDVPIAVVDQAQHDKLHTRINGSGPGGGTPTFAALTGGYAALENFVPSGALPPGGKKVLVIMTDGVPSGGASEQTQCTTAAAAELAKAGPKGPVTTFAVGIGIFPSTDTKNYDPAFMGRLAQSGGTAPAGCNPAENADVTKVCHFQVTPNGKPAAQLTQEFVDAINKIRGAVASCEYVLQKPDGGTGAADPTKINVVYTDGMGVVHNLVQDGTNGWTYDDPNNPTRVILHGTDCDTVKADPNGKISIKLGCKTITN